MPPPEAECCQPPLPKPTAAPGAAGLTPGLWVMDEVPGKARPKYLRRENTGGSYRGDEMQTEPWTPAAGPELGYRLGKRPGCCVRSLKPIHVFFFFPRVSIEALSCRRARLQLQGAAELTARGRSGGTFPSRIAGATPWVFLTPKSCAGAQQ